MSKTTQSFTLTKTQILNLMLPNLLDRAKEHRDALEKEITELDRKIDALEKKEIKALLKAHNKEQKKLEAMAKALNKVVGCTIFSVSVSSRYRGDNDQFFKNVFIHPLEYVPLMYRDKVSFRVLLKFSDKLEKLIQEHKDKFLKKRELDHLCVGRFAKSEKSERILRILEVMELYPGSSEFAAKLKELVNTPIKVEL